jgi:hypothetical protein
MIGESVPIGDPIFSGTAGCRLHVPLLIHDGAPDRGAPNPTAAIQPEYPPREGTAAMNLRKLFLLLTLFVVPITAPAAPAAPKTKAVIVVQDRAAFVKALRADGYKRKGGIEKWKTDSGDDTHFKSFPHFSSSFRYQGSTYPYTMVGYPPTSGKTATIRPVIVPLRMNFVFFDTPASFDPSRAVDNIVKSPLFSDATFPNGVGQFGDMLQRATFWNRMDIQRKWHVQMSKPRVLDTVDVAVEPDIGELFQIGSDPNALIGNLRFGAIDSTIHTILQFLDVQPDELPIFVTSNVTADALGYHDAFPVGRNDGTQVLQTLIYTSWLDGSLVGDLLADVSTLNHEMGEWLNDPYVNNIVPLWAFPPKNKVCGDNPFLEVGDPQGNGPDFEAFPTVPIRVNGFTYHLQDLVMLPWFAGESPSSAFGGWYDFPDGKQIQQPFVACGP